MTIIADFRLLEAEMGGEVYPRGILLRLHALQPVFLDAALWSLRAGLTALGRIYSPPLLPHLTENLSHSFDTFTTPIPLIHGMLVEFSRPESVAEITIPQRNLGPPMPLLKPITALLGKMVCIQVAGKLNLAARSIIHRQLMQQPTIEIRPDCAVNVFVHARLGRAAINGQ